MILTESVQTVWLYHVFSLSLRDVELLLAERGIIVSYETVRRWCPKFGQSFAHGLRRRRPRQETSGTWMRCSSESRVFNIICGVAVDQCGVVLDILVQNRRNAIAAKRRRTELAKLWPNLLTSAAPSHRRRERPARP